MSMLFNYTQKKALMFYGHLIFFYTVELHTRNFEFNVIFVLFGIAKERLIVETVVLNSKI